MKKILLLMFLLVTIKTIAQSNNDVRKSQWGMSIDEVIKSEIQLKPIFGTKSFKDASGALIKEDDLTYDNVLIDNGLTTKIVYGFNNKQLMEVTIIVYGNSPSNIATKSKVISFKNKVRQTSYIFKALQDKGYGCNYGWCFPYKLFDCEMLGIKGPTMKCSMDENTLDAVYKVAQDCAKSPPTISLINSNRRTDLRIVYNEWDLANYGGLPETETYDDFYNTICWLHYTPSSQVTNQLKKDRF